MSTPRLAILAFLVTCFSGIYTTKINAQEYDLNISTDLFWPAPNFDRPSYLQASNDPTFGTSITRVVGNVGSSIQNISGESWRNVARHGYSVRQPWNADETVLYLGRHRTYNSSWGPSLFIDGETYEPISTASEPSGNEHRWHPTNPNLRLILRDNSVITWNYQTGQTNTLMTFNGYSNTSMGYTGNWSDDAHKIAMFATRNSDGKTVVFALDTQTGTKYPDIDASSIDIDYVSISPLGNYILINGNFGQGSDRTKIYDLNGNQVGPYWSEYGRPSHFDMAVDQNGDEVAVGVDKANGQGIIKRKLSNGEVTVLVSGCWGIHVSARSLGRPGWAYASTSTSTSWGPRLGEIIAFKLDGSRVERICHARNEFSDYQNEAHPCPSPSGGRVIFATDWGTNGLPIQGYVADFRDSLISNGFSVNAGPDQTVCEGEEVTLSASGASSYLWSNGETSSTITVSPNQTTTYTVTGTDSQGNEATDSVVVIVKPLPNADAGGDVEICQDDTVTLTASGGDTYLWNTGQETQSITVSPDDTTTYSVTVTLNGCSSSDEVQVTVKPKPQINAGTDIDLNLGESTTLTAEGEGSFEWSTGETSDSITVTPTETTTYTVTTFLNGCTNQDSVTVHVIDQNTVEANAGEDVEICQGETVSLTASGGSEFVWSTGETSQTISVSPNQTTTYTVTVYEGSASDTDDVIVTVNQLPDANAGEDVTINYGESVTLTATGGNQYEWSTGETSQSITVNPVEDTIYTVEVINNGCSSTDSVQVFVTTQAFAGDDVTICQGETVTLTASDGTAYQWSTGETAQSIVVNPSQTTTFTVTVFNGNSSDQAEVTVFVNPIPNANAGEDALIESGQSVTLSASGGNSYLWSNGATTQHISVSPTETTVYTVEAIINGCSDFDEVLVEVVQPVQAYAGENIESCPGETVTLTASGGLYYLWNTGETTATIAVSPTENSQYTVEVSNGITTETATVSVYVDDCYALDEEYQNTFDYVVYPNPSDGEVNVKLSGLQTISSISISDLSGKTIKVDTFDDNNGNEINKSYDLSYLSRGLYLVKLSQSGKDPIVKKLIIK